MKTYKQITPEMIQKDIRYLELLSHDFPNLAAASTEIINLEAILNLPKGTEHFLADLHGEYEAFQHVLRNASGAIKRKVNEIFGNNLREMEKKELCTLIYYPEQKLQLVKEVEKDLVDWYVITLNQLVKVCQNVSSKYTRSKVRKALPEEFSYIIQELLHESPMDPNKQAYINVIIRTIIETRRADDFIIALCNLIQRLTIDFRLWKTDTASTCFRWLPLLWKPTPTTHANTLLLRLRPKAVHTMTRPCGSSRRCTRPSPLSSSSWKMLPSGVIRNST